MSFEPIRFVDGRPMVIAGIDARYACSETSGIPAQWQRLEPYLGSLPNQIGCVSYGVSHAMQPDSFGYLAGVEVIAPDSLPEGFATVQLPAQRYAVFEHAEHVSKLCVTIDRIFNEWLPSSGRALADSPVVIERYGEAFDPKSCKGDVEVWVSLK